MPTLDCSKHMGAAVMNKQKNTSKDIDWPSREIQGERENAPAKRKKTAGGANIPCKCNCRVHHSCHGNEKQLPKLSTKYYNASYTTMNTNVQNGAAARRD